MAPHTPQRFERPGEAVTGVVVTPVDVPLVSAGVIEALLKAVEVPGGAWKMPEMSRLVAS